MQLEVDLTAPPSTYVQRLGALLTGDRGPMVLDIGCGSGNLSRRIATNGATVVALDLKLKTIQNWSDKDCCRVNARYPNLPFRRGSFALIHCYETLHLLEIDKRFLAVLAGCGRPDAYLVVGWKEMWWEKEIVRRVTDLLSGHMLSWPEENPTAKALKDLQRVFPGLRWQIWQDFVAVDYGPEMVASAIVRSSFVRGVVERYKNTLLRALLENVAEAWKSGIDQIDVTNLAVAELSLAGDVHDRKFDKWHN